MEGVNISLEDVLTLLMQQNRSTRVHGTVESIFIHQCVLLLKEQWRTKKNGCVLRVGIKLETTTITTIRRRRNRHGQQGNENDSLPGNMTKNLLLRLVMILRVMVLILLVLLLLLLGIIITPVTRIITMTIIIRRMQDQTVVLLQLQHSRLLPLLLTRRQKRKNILQKIDITRT